MKLFEDMEKMGGSVHGAIQNMMNDIYQDDFDDDDLKAIIDELSLSDLLALDNAYSSGDEEAVKAIIDPDMQLEYSMGTGRQAASAAAERPAPAGAAGKAAAKKPGAQATTQTTRNYSGGVQNGVSTTNVDNENNPDEIVQDPEEIDEGESTNENKKYYAAVARQLGVKLGTKGQLTKYSEGNYSRTIKMTIGDKAVELFHTWKRDGSEGKPVTYLSIDNDDSIDLGRFAIWNGKPKDYAEDLAAEIEKDSRIEEGDGTEHDMSHYLALANFVDEYAYKNGIEYGSEDLGVNDTADEFSELGIDSEEAALEWLQSEVNRQETDREEYVEEEVIDEEVIDEDESVEETTVVEMVDWLQRRAGIE